MARNKRRHSVGFGYIGFGNSRSVFNQTSNKAFSALKEKLNEETHVHYKLNFSHKELSKAEREIIKNKIRKEEKRKSLQAIVLTILVLFIIIVTFREYLLYSINNRTNPYL
ncbi:hypothetical protein [Hwangdonia seohaensis]|uniref:Uncharacterized protein n=1 Tax=Hwangdonia seohaensis TaxID=1240727 RepID=A0ABW3RC57_9FLAO|nr:hypothetical protein [Hwangdonia seohaensis]